MSTLLEALKENKLNEEVDNIKVDTGLTGKINYDILQSVLGQLSDGIWENSRAVEKYWRNLDVELDGDKVIIIAPSNYKYLFNWTSEKDIKEYFATKIKQIIKNEGLDWKRDNQDESIYLKRNDTITVTDAYKAYDTLKERDTLNKKYEGLESGIESGLNETNTESGIESGLNESDLQDLIKLNKADLFESESGIETIKAPDDFFTKNKKVLLDCGDIDYVEEENIFLIVDLDVLADAKLADDESKEFVNKLLKLGYQLIIQADITDHEWKDDEYPAGGSGDHIIWKPFTYPVINDFDSKVYLDDEEKASCKIEYNVKDVNTILNKIVEDYTDKLFPEPPEPEDYEPDYED